MCYGAVGCTKLTANYYYDVYSNRLSSKYKIKIGFSSTVAAAPNAMREPPYSVGDGVTQGRKSRINSSIAQTVNHGTYPLGVRDSQVLLFLHFHQVIHETCPPLFSFWNLLDWQFHPDSC